MRGSLDQPPIVVRGSRWRGVGLVVLAAFLSIGSTNAMTSSGPNLSAILFLGVFVLFGEVGLVLVLWPARLEIAPSGITQKVLWRTTRLPWSDVYNFRPVGLGLTTRMVGFDYLVERPNRTGLRRLNAAVAGVQGALQPGLAMSPAKLANLLNEARERWLTQSDPLPEGAIAAPLPGRLSPLAALSASRLDRQTYWIAAGGLTAISIAFSLLPGTRAGIGGVSTVLLIRIFTGRLHDLGRSGWWQVIPFILMLGALITAGLMNDLETVGFAAAFLIQLLFTIALGLFRGDPRTNKFGPPPGVPTPQALSETFR